MGLKIDRYQVERLLGQGAMGKVYLAYDPKLERRVAIKVLSTGASDRAVRERFRLEARAVAALKHPNIVELYDYSGEDADDLYLVMEYVGGASLYQLVADRGAMPEAVALAIAHELTLALEHAHKNQIVHRDLKPENVLLADGRVVLTDFGGVKAIAAKNPIKVRSIRSRTQVLGTPGFMAPEQFAGKGIDARTDLFALGAVLYNLVTEHLPFEGDTPGDVYERVRRGRYRNPRELNPQLSEPFCALLRRCLAPRPIARFLCAAVMRDEILEALAQHGVTEVRQELKAYEADSQSYAVAGRERAVVAAVRDLKVAIKDRDHTRARSIIERMQLWGPGERLNDITGFALDARQQPVFQEGARMGKPHLWLVSGLLLGGAFGVALSGALYALRLIPAAWLQALVALGWGR